ncbi:hypothetical protein WG66_013454 [Moniliophthora roreri]|nr:hypothetical protein WG66_013454 [Moniliophthora roreri]
MENTTWAGLLPDFHHVDVPSTSSPFDFSALIKHAFSLDRKSHPKVWLFNDIALTGLPVTNPWTPLKWIRSPVGTIRFWENTEGAFISTPDTCPTAFTIGNGRHGKAGPPRSRPTTCSMNRRVSRFLSLSQSLPHPSVACYNTSEIKTIYYLTLTPGNVLVRADLKSDCWTPTFLDQEYGARSLKNQAALSNLDVEIRVLAFKFDEKSLTDTPML